LSVITEKPFAMSFAEGTAMAQAAAKSRGVLAVVHNFQFARSIAKLERDLESGAIGQIRAVRAVQFGNPERRLPTWIDQLPLGLFYDESPHLLYLLNRIAGPIEFAKAVVVDNQTSASTPAQVDAWFRSPKGYPVTLSCSFEATISEWYLLVHGSRGVGIVDIFRDIYVRLPNDGRHGTAQVVRTSALATWQHWAQHLTSGALHVGGKLRYGNDQVFARFAAGARGDSEALRPIDASSALGTLGLQHQIIEHAERLSL
jgi:predicted dehydrogenase